MTITSETISVKIEIPRELYEKIETLFLNYNIVKNNKVKKDALLEVFVTKALSEACKS